MVDSLPFKNELAVVGVKATAFEHLFNVEGDADKLDDKRGGNHTTVSKGLFFCKRAHPYKQISIVFLCNRVPAPDEDNWKNIIRLINYLKYTKELFLNLRSKYTTVMRWYVDASFAVNPYFKSHTGGTFTLRNGSLMSISTKQNLNTKSSTKAELVAAGNIAG